MQEIVVGSVGEHLRGFARGDRAYLRASRCRRRTKNVHLCVIHDRTFALVIHEPCRSARIRRRAPGGHGPVAVLEIAEYRVAVALVATRRNGPIEHVRVVAMHHASRFRVTRAHRVVSLAICERTDGLVKECERSLVRLRDVRSRGRHV